MLLNRLSISKPSDRSTAKNRYLPDVLSRWTRPGIILLTVLLVTGCVSSNENGSGNNGDRSLSKSVEDRFSLSKDVRQKQRQKLKKSFQEMKQAVVNGDLKALQGLWVHPSGDTYSMEELSSMYTRRGEKMAARVRDAEIVDPPGVKIEPPSRSIRKRHPDARYAASLLVLNSYGTTLNLPAIYTGDTWRFIQPIRLNQSD